jgi:hypothetical protein
VHSAIPHYRSRSTKGSLEKGRNEIVYHSKVGSSSTTKLATLLRTLPLLPPKPHTAGTWTSPSHTHHFTLLISQRNNNSTQLAARARFRCRFASHPPPRLCTLEHATSTSLIRLYPRAPLLNAASNTLDTTEQQLLFRKGLAGADVRPHSPPRPPASSNISSSPPLTPLNVQRQALQAANRPCLHSRPLRRPQLAQSAVDRAERQHLQRKGADGRVSLRPGPQCRQQHSRPERGTDIRMASPRTTSM